MARRLALKQVEQLPACERAVFILRYVQRRPADEVAQGLGLSMAEVRERCVRALGRCRAGLAALLDDLPNDPST